jgi:hypothetical protein
MAALVMLSLLSSACRGPILAPAGRGKTLGEVRGIIKEADPEIDEDALRTSFVKLRR